MFKAFQKRFLILPFVLLLVVCLFVLPVSAAIAVKPLDSGDLSIEYDGVNKIATYTFDVGSAPYWSVSIDGGTRTKYDGATYQCETSYSSFSFDCICWPAENYYVDITDLNVPSLYEITFKPLLKFTIDSGNTVKTWTGRLQMQVYYFDSTGQTISYEYGYADLAFDTSVTDVPFDGSFSFRPPEGTCYVRPYIRFSSTLPTYAMVNLVNQGFSLSFNSNMIADNSDTQKQILDKLDKMQENEKQEANSQGQAGIDDISGAIPDYTEELKAAFADLAGSLQYNGTEAKIDIPEVTLPGLEGLYDGFTVMEPQTLDFEVYIDMMPSGLMLLVQSLLTIALILFCAKELYGLISYILTLRGGGSNE